MSHNSWCHWDDILLYKVQMIRNHQLGTSTRQIFVPCNPRSQEIKRDHLTNSTVATVVKKKAIWRGARVSFSELCCPGCIHVYSLLSLIQRYRWYLILSQFPCSCSSWVCVCACGHACVDFYILSKNKTEVYFICIKIPEHL